MAVTQNTYTGNGSTVLYSFTFPYLETTDIKVSVNGTVVTTYTFANATTIQFNTAPANGAAIRIYRQTDDSALPATFYPGSAIRSADLNDNFTQNLYVTQESTNNAATATSTANTALSNSSTALSQSNTAIADSATALSQSNTAISDSATALSQSNTAISDSASAVSTANTASTNASNAVTTANTALSTANTASSNASAAVSTANTASSNASAAVSTANTASSNASTALSTANTALSTATTADTNATAALNAVAGTVQYVLVANVAAIPGTPANGDAIEIADSTGIESFTPLTNLPAGYVGDPGLSVRLQYLSAGSSWNWLNYFANNAETRYLKLAGGTLTGALGVTTGTAAAPSVFISGDPNTGIYSPGADQVAVATNGAGRLFIDASGLVDVQSQSASVTRIGGGASLFVRRAEGSYSSPTAISSSVSLGGIAARGYGTTDYRAVGNMLFISDGAISDSSSPGYIAFATTPSASTTPQERARITSAGLVGVGTSNPGTILHCNYASATDTYIRTTNSVGTAGFDFGVSSGGEAWVFNRNNSNMYLGTNSAQRVTITSGGNVGIGTTSPGGELHVAGSDANTDIFITEGSTSTDARIRNSNGVLLLDADVNNENAGSAFVFGVDGTERARIDALGRLLVGTSTSATYGAAGLLQILGSTNAHASIARATDNNAEPTFNLAKARGSVGTPTVVVSGDSLGRINFVGHDGTDYESIGAWIKGEVDGTPGANTMPGRLVFSTTSTTPGASPTERMRIGSTGQIFGFATSVTALSLNNSAASGTTVANIVARYGAAGITGGTNSFIVWTNGDVVNTNNSYGAISDIKLKENIVDANSQWDDLKALQVRKYNFRKGQTHTQIGLVAQEVELVSPGLVSESPDRDEDGNDLGTVTKSVNYSVLYMKAVKALQEAMERIETLEQRLNDAGIN